jgi:hypothetical protein
MRHQRFVILLALGAMLCASAQAAQPAATPGASASGAVVNPNLTTPVVPPLIIIAPTEVRTDPTLAKGCWVRLFPEPNFQGVDDLTIAGPISLPSLHTPVGIDWKHKTESLLVGPKATVTVYESQSYRDKAAVLQPGTKEAQLGKNLKFAMSIDSLKIGCAR